MMFEINNTPPNHNQSQVCAEVSARYAALRYGELIRLGLRDNVRGMDFHITPASTQEARRRKDGSWIVGTPEKDIHQHNVNKAEDAMLGSHINTANRWRLRSGEGVSSLVKAFEVSRRSTREDWQEWIRRLAVELLRASPSPSLSACFALSISYPPLANELLGAAFESCWVELDVRVHAVCLRALEQVNDMIIYNRFSCLRYINIKANPSSI